MKSTQISAVLLAGAAAVSAQTYNQSQGFTLSLVDSQNSTICGWQISACHAGAAIEALCITPPASPAQYTTYYLNTTQYEPTTGPLVWNLPYTESEALMFEYSVNSNVATPLFFPSSPNAYFGFDADNKLYAVGSYDDSTFTSAFPNVTGSFPVYHWEACYTYTEGYYYFTLAWVTYGSPSNPTCTATNVTRTFV